MDIKHGCMLNSFGHILFGKLKGLYNNKSDPYYGDRIYIKPEEFDIQKFQHYVRHVGNYLKHVSRRITCKIKRLQRSPICSNVRAFRENIDLRLTTKWSHILSTISILTDDERQSMRLNASKHGIHESMFYNDYIQVRDYCKQLEKKYVVVMHGHEKEMKLFLQLNNYYKVEYRVS